MKGLQAQPTHSDGGSLFFDANFAILFDDHKAIAIGGMMDVGLGGRLPRSKQSASGTYCARRQLA